MANKILSKKHTESIRKASREEIQGYFRNVPERERKKKWLHLGNRYRVTCTEQYNNDLDSGSINDSHLVEYIAASGPAHIIDGWSLISRALEAAFRGDHYSSIHYGYYAELRAAAGLMASEGIGLFNNKHPIVQDTGKIWKELRTIPTHRAVWPTLKYWASLKRASDLLDILVSPGGHSVGDWLAASGKLSHRRAVASRWLSSWGVDLSVLGDDHNWRNLASYRPSEFRPSPALDPKDLVKFVDDLWCLFEPEPSSGRRFPRLESHLLRQTLRSFGASPSAANIERLGFDSHKASEWSKFLSGSNELLPLKFAHQTSRIEDPNCHLQIISRAALLLFLATSASRVHLTKASYSPQTIAFWWSQHGERRGLWDAGDCPTNPLDLWADIEGALDDARTWMKDAGAGSTSMRSWRRDQSLVLNDLGGLELAGVWGLIP